MQILSKQKDYLDFLINHRGLIVEDNAKHSFWHKIQTYVIDRGSVGCNDKNVDKIISRNYSICSYEDYCKIDFER